MTDIEYADNDYIYATIEMNWHWVISFALSIAPCINVTTGAIGQIGDEQAQAYVAIPAHGSPYQNNQCIIRAHKRQKGSNSFSSLIIGELTISNSYDKDTFLTATTKPSSIQFWSSLIVAIGGFERTHYTVERAAVGTQFTAILDQYYEQKAHGRKVKLAALARQYNVNYASLRQAKIRYDRRFNLTDPASGEPDEAGLYVD